MAMFNCLFKKRQKKGRTCLMAQSNQFIRVIVDTHMGDLFSFGTVPFLLQHPALLKT